MTVLAAPLLPAHALVLPLSGLRLLPAELDGSDAVELRTGHGELIGVLYDTTRQDLRVAIAVAREVAGDPHGWTIAAGSAPIGLPIHVDFRSLHAPVPKPGAATRSARPALRLGPWWVAETRGVLPVVVASAAATSGASMPAVSVPAGSLPRARS
jgi:hypothetical protein